MLGECIFVGVMSRNSSYFRHSLSAHKDRKISMLISNRNGLAAVGFYYILLEVFGAYFNEDETRNTVQKIPLRILANAAGLRTDSARTLLGLCTDCELINTVHSKSHVDLVEVEIPNFPKYFGKYEKTEPKNVLKEKKIKEKKEEEEKEASSPSSTLRINIVMNFYNQILSGLDCARWNATTQKMNQAFELAVKHLPTYEDWKKYFTAIKGKDFKGVSMVTPQFVLSENLIARYLNGEFENQDFDLMLEKLFDEAQKEN